MGKNKFEKIKKEPTYLLLLPYDPLNAGERQIQPLTPRSRMKVSVCTGGDRRVWEGIQAHRV